MTPRTGARTLQAALSPVAGYALFMIGLHEVSFSGIRIRGKPEIFLNVAILAANPGAIFFQIVRIENVVPVLKTVVAVQTIELVHVSPMGKNYGRFFLLTKNLIII
jgi:uncharacterized membrane protein